MEKNINLVGELETILKRFNYMGNDKVGCNLAVNDILNRIDELGFNIVKNEERSINIKWSVKDVRSLDNTLSDNDCMEILNNIKDNHDATVGVNWEVIKMVIENFKCNNK